MKVMRCGELKHRITSDPRFEPWVRDQLDRVEQLTQQGWLQDFDPSGICAYTADGFVAKVCCDGTQFMTDIAPHLTRDLRSNKLHVIGTHGAATSADHEFPSNLRGPDGSEYLIDQMVNAYGLGYSALVLVEHVPCLWSFLHHSNVDHQLRSAIRVKQLVKARAIGMKVLCLLQIDRGDQVPPGKRRHVTRSFSSKKLSHLLFPKHDHHGR